jgi:uncharacterized membrane protein
LAENPSAVLGVVVAPGLAQEVTSRIADDLLDDLRERYGSVEWRAVLEVDRLVEPPAPLTEIFTAARKKLLDGEWDIGIVVTDLPLHVAGRAVSHQVNPTHGIAVVSLPALGAIHLRPRLRRALLQLVANLVGDGEENERKTLRQLVTDTVQGPGALRLLFVPAVLLSHLRLLLGMVRANRPWRFAARLYRALVAALAAAAFGLVSSDVWRLADTMGWWRLAILSIVSITLTIVSIIAAHGLWERAPEPRVRSQVVLFNLATAATVKIGILSLYLALFALVLAGAALVISSTALRDALGHGVTMWDYVALAWFIASMATLGGGLGASLESQEAVREAAYASSEPVEPEETP